MTCNAEKMGREYVFKYALSTDCETVPDDGNFTSMLAFTAKSFEANGNPVTSSNDASLFQTNRNSTKSLTMSGSLEVYEEEAIAAQMAFKNQFMNYEAAGYSSAFVWVRIESDLESITAYMNIDSLSQNMDTDALAAFDISLSLAGSAGWTYTQS